VMGPLGGQVCDTSCKAALAARRGLMSRLGRALNEAGLSAGVMGRRHGRRPAWLARCVPRSAIEAHRRCQLTPRPTETRRISAD
jgi:hypothetical protein